MQCLVMAKSPISVEETASSAYQLALLLLLLVITRPSRAEASEGPVLNP